MPAFLDYEKDDELVVVMRKYYNLKGNAYVTIKGPKFAISEVLDYMTRYGFVIYTIKKQREF